MKHSAQTHTVARINNTAITIVENGKKLIPIKPICQALGINEKSQREKINSDQILSSVKVLSTSTGSDGKQYEMFCIPFKYVFGWLFTINPKNVASEAQEAVLIYRMECYDALFNHFAEQSEYLEQKQAALEKQMEEVERIKQDFKNAKSKLDEANQKLNGIRNFSFDQWKVNKSQLTLMFPDEVQEDF